MLRGKRSQESDFCFNKIKALAFDNGINAYYE